MRLESLNLSEVGGVRVDITKRTIGREKKGGFSGGVKYRKSLKKKKRVKKFTTPKWRGMGE